MPEKNQIVTEISNWDIGDLLVGSAQGRSARLAGSTSASVRVLTQQGDGKRSAKPLWTDLSDIIPSGLAKIAKTGSADDLIAGTIPAARFPALTGDVTTTAGSLATTISSGAVGNGKLAKMPPLTIKGNNSILPDYPKDLTVAQLNAMGIGGGGGGSGTVTSVGLSGPSIFDITGTPVTTAGTLAIGLANQLANTVWAGPSTGASAAPAFRGLASGDIPDLSTIYQPLNAKLTAIGSLANAAGVLTNNGSGVFTYTTPGSGDFVGPSSATDNAVVRFDTTTGKLGQNSLFIVDDSGNVSDGGILPGSTAFYFERSGVNIATFKSTGNDARLRLIRPDNSKGAFTEFIRTDTGNEWYMGTPYTAASPSGTGNDFTVNYYDGTDHLFLGLTSAGVLSLGAYTTPGFLQVNSSGVVSVGTPSGSAPGGNNNDIQYKNGTAFAGSDDFQFDSANSTVKLGYGGHDYSLWINGGAGGPPYAAWFISGSAKGSIGAAAAANQFFSGTAANELVIKSDGGQGISFSGNGTAKQMGLSSLGAIQLSAYTTAGLLANDASGNVSTATIGSGLSLSSGVLSSTGQFSVPIRAGNYTVSGLPSASSNPYSFAFVTDATLTAITGLGLSPTGGGSNKVPVYSDGTNWIML